jgi:Flp pilus assembly protein TadD
MNIDKAILSAVAFHSQGNLKQAEYLYKKILTKKPNNPDILNKLGELYCQFANYDLAIKYIRKALQFRPIDIASAHFNLGWALYENGQLDEAITHSCRAIELKPFLAEAHCNLGAALYKKGQLDEAITHYQKALEINPSFTTAYCSLGWALHEKGQHNEAIVHYRKFIETNPQSATANLELSVLLLLLGNFKEGWAKYECRFKTYDYQTSSSHPLWDGSVFEGRTISLYAEQGLGDTIQFVRYAPLIAQKGAKVIIHCQRELVPLIRNAQGITKAAVQGEEFCEFDFYYPLLSLPLLFNTTLESIPAKVPYIKVDYLLVQKWRNKIQADDSKLKIGLAWAGSPKHRNDHNRSCHLDVFSSLSEFSNISFYSLQKGSASEQTKNVPKGMKFIDYTEEIIDFSDTAALMENLDLIISVDTSVVHLAGALGKRVWTLLPFVPDWRWMLNKEDSPWYPTMRLFRQPSSGDWYSVIAEVKSELQKLLANN